MSKTTLNVYKIGGKSIDDPAALRAFLDVFVADPNAKILVHGGGVLAAQLAQSLHIPVVMHEGRRITDADTLRIVTMVYAGWINKTLVAQLEARGCRAVGISGADAGCMRSVRRAPEPLDYGFVGDITPQGINTHFLASLLRAHTTPVCCSITCTAEGQLLNTNADTIASNMAISMCDYFTTRLIFAFDKDGVLYPKATAPIPLLSYKQYQAMKADGAITDGMIPKLDNAFSALEQGVATVCIGKTQLQL